MHIQRSSNLRRKRKCPEGIWCLEEAPSRPKTWHFLVSLPKPPSPTFHFLSFSHSSSAAAGFFQISSFSRTIVGTRCISNGFSNLFLHFSFFLVISRWGMSLRASTATACSLRHTQVLSSLYILHHSYLHFLIPFVSVMSVWWFLRDLEWKW